MSGSLANLEDLAELDVRFHLLIAAASGNTLAEEIVNAIVPAFCESNRAVLYVGSANMQKTIQEHQRIIDALASREAEEAESAIRAHIARVRKDIDNLPAEGQAEEIAAKDQRKGDESPCKE